MKVALSAGGRFHSIEIAKQLNRLGVDYKLYTGADVPKDIPKTKVKSYRLIPIISYALRQIAFSEKTKRKIYSFSDDAFDKAVASNISTDLDLFHGFSVYSLYTMRKLHKKGIPCIIDRGSVPAQEYDKIVNEEYNSLGLKYHGTDAASIKKQDAEYKEADIILSPAKYVTESLVKIGVKREKIICLPYGGPEVSKKSPKTEKFRILFIGGTGIAKGLHYLIEAFQELNRPDTELLVIGKIEKEFPIKNVPNVIFKQKLVGKDLEEAFLSSSVLVLHSLSDGWGMVVTEAMSFGLPVIVSENTGAKDAVQNGKNGFIVPIKNAKAIKDKLQFLYNNPTKAKQMGKKAKQMAKTYTWNNYGKKLVKIYKKLV